MDTPPVIELRGITKRFPGVVANRDVTLAVAPRTVHALVGENGVGRSTLVKTLHGMQRPAPGRSSTTSAPQGTRSGCAARGGEGR